MFVTVIFSLASAFSFGSAVAAQHHVASKLTAHESLRPRTILRLLRRPLWTIAFFGEMLGFGLQLVALHHGSLLVVQPLMTTSLVFAITLSVAAAHASLPRSDWLALLAVILGLVVFMLVAAPSTDAGSHASALRWWLTIGPIVVLIGWCLLTGHGAVGLDRAVRLAAGSAGISAVLVSFAKVLSDQLSVDAKGVLATWSPYAIAITGIVAVIVQQAAFQTARPTVTLPILAALEPIIGVVIGVVLFDELPTVDALTVVVGLAALALLLGGIVKLATDAPHLGAEPRHGAGSPSPDPAPSGNV